jgi:hypothetical protein
MLSKSPASRVHWPPRGFTVAPPATKMKDAGRRNQASITHAVTSATWPARLPIAQRDRSPKPLGGLLRREAQTAQPSAGASRSRERLYPPNARPAKPMPSIAQLDGSGTPVVTANSKSLEPVVNTTLPYFSGVRKDRR